VYGLVLFFICVVRVCITYVCGASVETRTSRPGINLV